MTIIIKNIATIENGIVRPIKPGIITITIKDIYNSNMVSYDLEIKNVIETLNINDLNDKYLDNEEIDLLETTKLYYQKKIEDLVD